jgi:hypothetical protein
VLATEWPEFRELDLRALRDVMVYPVVVDTRNALDPAAMIDAGFSYYPTGRPSQTGVFSPTAPTSNGNGNGNGHRAANVGGSLRSAK